MLALLTPADRAGDRPMSMRSVSSEEAGNIAAENPVRSGFSSIIAGTSTI